MRRPSKNRQGWQKVYPTKGLPVKSATIESPGSYSTFITSLVIVKETSPAEGVDSWSFDSQSQWKCHLRHGSQPPSPQAQGIPLLKLWAGHGLWQPEGNPKNWGLNVPRFFDHPAGLVWYGYVLHECCQAEMEIHQCFLILYRNFNTWNLQIFTIEL